MLILKLLDINSIRDIPVTITDKLGDGSDGEVFSIKEDINKVIKLSILFDFDLEDLNKRFESISEIFNYLIINTFPYFAKVYEQSYLCQWEAKLADGSYRKYICYYSIMEKLQKISEDEKKVFHSIICHEDREIKKDYTVENIKEMLHGMSFGLDFDDERIISFIKKLRTSPIEHLDIHVRNIMKDSRGNFKMIDFERVKFNNKL